MHVIGPGYVGVHHGFEHRGTHQLCLGISSDLARVERAGDHAGHRQGRGVGPRLG
jgi:hypothetical protein